MAQVCTLSINRFGAPLTHPPGILLLLLSLIPVTKLQGSTWSLRLAIGSSGIWWGFFTFISGILIPNGKHAETQLADEESTELAENEFEEQVPSEDRTEERWLITRLAHEILYSWSKLLSTLRPSEIRKLRETFKFLAAWFILSDGLSFPHLFASSSHDFIGFSTITSTAVLFAKTTLDLPPSKLIIVGILTPMFGVFSSLLMPFIQKRYGWQNRKVLVGCVIGVGLVPAYGCLGFLSTSFGLRTQGEMFVFAVYFGQLFSL